MKITPDCGAVTMVKPLLLVAVLANIFFLVSSTGTVQTCSHSSSAASSSYSSSSSSSETVQSAGGHECVQKQQSSSKSAASSSSSSSSSSTTSTESDYPQCPDWLSCDGPHEYYDCAGACDNVCATLHKQNQTNCPIKNIKCTDMCYCEEGYARNNYNICIPIEKCEPICKGKHEVYSECIQADCRPKKCCELGFPIPCPRIDPKYCKKGCLCKEGYVRNEKGVCIPVKECPSCGGDTHAESGCGTNCGRLCSNYFKKGVVCTLECNINGCDCKKGYVYDTNTKQCVLPKHCTPVCKKDEVYSECINGGCSPKNCSQIGHPIPCVKIDPKYCIKGCLCKEGYLREKNGVCVPAKECKPCCDGPHEYYDCAGACDNVCATLHKQNQTNCPIKNIKCTDMCYCEEGYARNNYNICIPIEKCEPICKGKHEVYSECIQGDCRPKKCCDLGFPIPCPRIDPKYCKKGCLCKEGYVTNEKGVCIPVKECPSCGGDPHAESGCGKNCGRLCSNYFKEGVVCTLECNINGCDCKNGYVYDTNTKQCVLPKHCTPVCKKDEVYSECINGGCSPKNCSQIGHPIPCVKIDPKYCIKGCLCKEDYLREDNGVCVPAKECKHKCNKPHEYYEPCDYDCPPKTCESLDRVYVCPIQKSDTCKPRCKCKKGYLRNKIGECITEAQCRKCMGCHEYFSCGGACDNVCDTLHKQNQTNCPIINIKCNEMCYCEKDYARAKNGTCIPIKKCHEPQCGKNEKYAKCPAWLCEPQKCCELGYPVPCPDIPPGSKCPVKPACVCVEGYVRDDKGNCIPKKECPSCGGDKNAESGCGINCLKKCYDLENPDNPKPCPKICKVNSCDCKKGYYYDENTNKCVCPKECSKPQCGKNERYEKCPAWLCEPQKCCELGYPIPCPDVPANAKCPVKPACVCDYGYVRDDEENCIPKKECPSCGGDCNAQSGCGVNCEKKCEDLGKEPGPCIDVCYFNACDCKDGYYYDKNENKCVLPSKCTGICSGKHEVFENCTNPICRPKSCCQLGFPLNCTEPPKCNKGCVCKEGYVRNSKGICIPIKECPSCGGDENAESGCGVNCLRKCYDLQNPNNPRPCPRICRFNSCDCKKGFYFDENLKKCVPPKKCTPSCCENEVYDSCVNGGCGPRNCSEIDGPILCIDPIKCKGGCTCKKGYLRLDDTGICVPKEKCPKICNQPNEEYVECPPTCHDPTCESIWNTNQCPKPNTKKEDCVGECRCIEGYYRNLIGECICKEDCLKCTGDHEYYSCGSACDNVENCYCEDGYARDDDGVCVCIDDCPGR